MHMKTNRHVTNSMTPLPATVLAILLCLGALSGRAQSLKENTANKYYNSLAYEKAAPMYAELAKKESASTGVIRRTADSYRLLGDMHTAETWYAKLVTKPDATAADHYNYAQVLLRNGKGDMATAEMGKVASTDQKNTVAARYRKAPANYDLEIRRDSSKFLVKNLEEINSRESDFSTSYLNSTTLVFASARENHGASNHQFAWDNTTFLDLYEAKIDTAQQTAETPERFVKGLKTKYHDGPVAFSPDGRTLVLSRNNYYERKLEKSTENTINIELYYAIKKADGTWGELQPVPFNNKDYSVGHACFSPDGSSIYFASDMPGGFGQTDIWTSHYVNGKFDAPLNLGQEVNTEGREMFPFVDEDELLVFASDGHVGLGGLDLHMARLTSATPLYIGNVGYPINTNADDFALVYDAKILKGYFKSNREGGKGKDDIYAVKFQEPLPGDRELNGIVLDELTKEPIPLATVIISDGADKPLREIVADEYGKFHVKVPKGTDFKVTARKEKYSTRTTALIPFASVGPEPVEVLLPKAEVVMQGIVRDGKTKERLKDVTITLVNTETKEKETIVTTSAGDFYRLLKDKKTGDKVSYSLVFKKQGYLTKSLFFTKEILTPDTVKIHEMLDITLHKLEVGADVAKMIDIKPIYFDLGKYNIRKDAAIELDKIVAIMKEYPSMVIELGSHTDCRSSYAFNMKLSDNRAKASAAYIVKKGINSTRIYGKGYGESKLLNGCACEGKVVSTCSEEEHQLNRRTEFIIKKM